MINIILTVKSLHEFFISLDNLITFRNDQLQFVD